MSKSCSKEHQTCNYFWNNEIYDILFIHNRVIREKLTTLNHEFSEILN